MSDRAHTPFRLSGAITGIPNNGLGKVIENLLEHVFSLKHLESLYHYKDSMLKNFSLGRP